MPEEHLTDHGVIQQTKLHIPCCFRPQALLRPAQALFCRVRIHRKRVVAICTFRVYVPDPVLGDFLHHVPSPVPYIVLDLQHRCCLVSRVLLPESLYAERYRFEPSRVGHAKISHCPAVFVCESAIADTPFRIHQKRVHLDAQLRYFESKPIR